MMMWAVVLPRVVAAFTFVQRCEPLMLNMLHNNRGFHTEPLTGHIYRHPVSYVRRNTRRSSIT